MSQTCVELVEIYFPGVSHKEAMDVLWSATAFPFVDVEHIKKQLAEHRTMIDDLKKRPGFNSWRDTSGLPMSDVELAMMIAEAGIDMSMKYRA